MTAETDAAARQTVAKQFVLPDVGEGLTEGEILKWLVAVGDEVTVNQPLVEIETAKAAVELPSPYAGQIAGLHAAEGDVLAVGSPLVTIAVEANEPTDVTQSSAPVGIAEASATTPSQSGPVLVGYGVTASATSRRPRLPAVSPHGTTRPEAGPPGEEAKPVRHGGLEVGRATEARFAQGVDTAAPVRAKPPVRKLAKELGIDIASLRPSSPDGIVSRADVEAASSSGESREPVRGVTRLMAEAVSSSAFSIPHVTEWVDEDVTASVEFLQVLRTEEEWQEVRLTPLQPVAMAVLSALRRFPLLNARFDGTSAEIVYRNRVNLGFAADTPRGLVVPNIKHADALPPRQLAQALSDLVDRAREGSASVAELTGGTFTITNVGALGVDGGTPIINVGESAILAVGAWRAKPWVHNGELAVRTVCTLALSFDHRFIDGATGARFLSHVAKRLNQPALLITEERAVSS